ncbi:MAG TPA: ATP-binding protein [Chloroflexota bacterium]|nr:ATP-binding protein [Chloroflexota bacterium]
MGRLGRLSLRAKIVGLTLAASLPCVAFAGVLSWQRVQDLQHERQVATLEMARVAASLVDALVESSQSSLMALGTNRALVRQNSDEASELLRRLLPSFPQHESLFAGRADGTVFADTWGIPPEGINIAGSPLFQYVISTGQCVVSEVFPNRIDGRPTIMFLAPIRGDDGQPVGVVGAHLNLATMHRIFSRLSAAPDTTLVSVNDVSGTIISRSINPDKTVGKSIGGSPLMQTVNDQMEGGGEIVFPDGVQRVLGFARTTAAPWRVIVGIPLDLAYAQVRDSALIYAVLMTLIAALTVLLAFVLAKRLTRMLDALVGRTRAIAAGKISSPGSMPDGHEFQTLTTTFDEMERALAASRAALEQKLSELELANRELKALDRAKSTFVATISHELRTPLTYLLGFSQLLRDRPTSPKEVEEIGQHMVDAARRLNRVVDDIIHFSELEAIGVRIEPTQVRLLDIVVETVAQLPVTTHPIQIDVTDALPPVQADPVRIGQVMTNLLSNATKFSPNGSEIVVDAQANNGRVVLSVSDCGIGVRAEEIESLFEPFQRGEQARVQQIGGFGLGLAICKRIVELHGGEIGVQSRPGGGSIFWFSLPAMATVAAKTNGAAKTNDAAKTNGAKTNGSPKANGSRKRRATGLPAGPRG